MRQTRTYKGFGAVAAVALAAGALANAAPAQAGSDRAGGYDNHVVAQKQELTRSEIRAADITNTERGQQELRAAEESGIEVNGRSMRVYEFGDVRYVLPVSTQFRVVRGVNAEGRSAVEAVPTALPREVSAEPGYYVPAASAFTYNNNSSFSETVGTWRRNIWWTLTKANDNRACSTCTPYDYWRLHTKGQYGVLTGSSASEGFKRGWIEHSRKSGWSTPVSFEPSQPAESRGTGAATSVSWGFGTNFSVNLGVPPVTASGGYDTTYGGTLNKNTENFHPIIRSVIGNGGSQWCRYESAEFTGTKMITARTSARISATGTMAGWDILRGMSDTTTNCPTQI